MEMEQMMIQSAANIHLEEAKKHFKAFSYNITDILARKQPSLLACFGFNIADLDVTFRKSQM